MNFFEHQRKAQSRTFKLVILFGLAIVALILAIYFPLQYYYYYHYIIKFHRPFVKANAWIWDWTLFLQVSCTTLLVIAGASIYKIRQLAQGGYIIAREMDGRLVEPTTTDLKEKQLLNVVEEISIAAGIPTPNVYIMNQEPKINAFAAGYTIGDAVIGITRGTLDKLNRDELQGVIAHEFSHILHGDMRLNIKLIGLLHGILFISLIGRGLMSSSDNRRSKKGSGGLIIAGLFFFIVGSIGYFFAKLIQAAVSRQREFLADASAVQYTRNPEGIGNALKKIAGYLGVPATGSYLSANNRAEISHMTFGAVGFLEGLAWASTHPSFEDRLKAIDPRFNPKNEKKIAEVTSSMIPKISHEPDQFERKVILDNEPFPVSNKINYTSIPISTLVGTIPAAAVAKQRTWLENMPPVVYQACHHPQKARAVMYVMLAEYNEDSKQKFIKILHLRDPHILESFEALWSPIKSLGPEARLRLADLSIPALRKMSYDDYLVFVKTMAELIESDQNMSMFEFLLVKMVKKHLRNYFKPQKSPPISITDPASVSSEMVTILSALAQADEDAFMSGASGLFPEAKMTPLDQISVPSVHAALKKICLSSFDIRKKLVDACGKVALFDQKVTWQEKELLRLIGDSIDCPIPLIN